MEISFAIKLWMEELFIVALLLWELPVLLVVYTVVIRQVLWLTRHSHSFFVRVCTCCSEWMIQIRIYIHPLFPERNVLDTHVQEFFSLVLCSDPVKGLETVCKAVFWIYVKSVTHVSLLLQLYIETPKMLYRNCAVSFTWFHICFYSVQRNLLQVTEGLVHACLAGSRQNVWKILLFDIYGTVYDHSPLDSRTRRYKCCNLVLARAMHDAAWILLKGYVGTQKNFTHLFIIKAQGLIMNRDFYRLFLCRTILC